MTDRCTFTSETEINILKEDVEKLLEENEQLKEVINKAIKKVKDISFKFGVGNTWVAVVLSTTEQGEELLEILGDDK